MKFEQNFDRAFFWLKKAAGKNHVSAQFLLGQCYRDGKGVKKSADTEKEALALFLQAAGQGHPGANFHVGVFFCFGFGNSELGNSHSEIPINSENFGMGIQYLINASDLGCVEATSLLQSLNT